MFRRLPHSEDSTRKIPRKSSSFWFLHVSLHLRVEGSTSEAAHQPSLTLANVGVSFELASHENVVRRSLGGGGPHTPSFISTLEPHQVVEKVVLLRVDRRHELQPATRQAARGTANWLGSASFKSCSRATLGPTGLTRAVGCVLRTPGCPARRVRRLLQRGCSILASVGFSRSLSRCRAVARDVHRLGVEERFVQSLAVAFLIGGRRATGRSECQVRRPSIPSIAPVPEAGTRPRLRSRCPGPRCRAPAARVDHTHRSTGSSPAGYW